MMALNHFNTFESSLTGGALYGPSWATTHPPKNKTKFFL